LFALRIGRAAAALGIIARGIPHYLWQRPRPNPPLLKSEAGM